MTSIARFSDADIRLWNPHAQQLIRLGVVRHEVVPAVIVVHAVTGDEHHADVVCGHLMLQPIESIQDVVLGGIPVGAVDLLCPLQRKSLIRAPHRPVLLLIDEVQRTRFHRKIALRDLHDAFDRFAYQPRLLIDLVILFASSKPGSFRDLLDDRTERAFTDETFKPLYEGLTLLQRAITRRLLTSTDVSSQAARDAYAVELERNSVSPGSVSDALKSLIDNQVLTNQAGWLNRVRHQRPPV